MVLMKERLRCKRRRASNKNCPLSRGVAEFGNQENEKVQARHFRKIVTAPSELSIKKYWPPKI